MDIKSILKKHWFLILFIAIIFLIVWYVVKGNSKTVTYYETHKDIKDGWSISKHIHVRERGGAGFTDKDLTASDIYFISSEGNCPMVDPEFNLYVFNDENVSMIDYFTGVTIDYSDSEVATLTSGNIPPGDPVTQKALLLLYSLTDIGLNVRIVNYARSLGVELDGINNIADYFNAILKAEYTKPGKAPTNEFDLKFLYLCSFLYVLRTNFGGDTLYKFENILRADEIGLIHPSLSTNPKGLPNTILNSHPFNKLADSDYRLENLLYSGINQVKFKAITSHNII